MAKITKTVAETTGGWSGVRKSITEAVDSVVGAGEGAAAAEGAAGAGATVAKSKTTQMFDALRSKVGLAEGGAGVGAIKTVGKAGKGMLGVASKLAFPAFIAYEIWKSFKDPEAAAANKAMGESNLATGEKQQAKIMEFLQEMEKYDRAKEAQDRSDKIQALNSGLKRQEGIDIAEGLTGSAQIGSASFMRGTNMSTPTPSSPEMPTRVPSGAPGGLLSILGLAE